MKIIRTKTKGCYQLRTNLIGTYLLKIDDPDPSAVTDDVVNGFIISDKAPKIPGDIWSALIELYFHFHKKGKEVCVVFLYNPSNDKWRAVVPKQSVTSASVTKDAKEGVDLLTGKRVFDYTDISEGYEYMGDSHLHPFDMPNFSAVDDTNELGLPGIHILVSSINLVKNTYVITPSVVAGKRRYIIKDYQELINITNTSTSYHPSCLLYVTEKVYNIKYSSSSKSPNINNDLVSSYDYLNSYENTWFNMWHVGDREERVLDLRAVLEELAFEHSKEEILGMVTKQLGDIYGI